MTGTYIALSFEQVGLAALLVLFNAAASLFLQLGLARRLIVATLRMTVQLMLVGLLLEWVFHVSTWPVVIFLMLAMTVIAGASAVGRTSNRFPGIYSRSIVSVLFSSWLVTWIALIAIIKVEPWYLPQYTIPLTGMILGNTLNGVSLGLDKFTTALQSERDIIEMKLALGATSWEASRTVIIEAVRTGMIPILNTMMVAGIVSLPGMMTGQLLAGVEPVQAVKYQVVIMLMIAAATALGTIASVLAAYKRLFTDSHQLLHGSITRLPE